MRCKLKFEDNGGMIIDNIITSVKKYFVTRYRTDTEVSVKGKNTRFMTN